MSEADLLQKLVIAACLPVVPVVCSAEARPPLRFIDDTLPSSVLFMVYVLPVFSAAFFFFCWLNV